MLLSEFCSSSIANRAKSYGRSIGRPYKDQFISGRALYQEDGLWNAGEVGKRATELFEKSCMSGKSSNCGYMPLLDSRQRAT